MAVLTADTGRFVEFYTDVFGAEVAGGQDVGAQGVLTVVRVGAKADIDLFEVRGNIAIWGCRRHPRRPSRRSAGGSSNGAQPTSS